MRKYLIFFGLVGLLLAAYFAFESNKESSAPVVLQPRNTIPTALTTSLDTHSAIEPVASTTAEPSLTEQIKALEASGVVPKLDRSSSIKGPDQDLNGVRDDIDAWIAALPITDTQKKAATQEAKSTQKALLVDLTDQLALQAVGDEAMAGIVCLKDTFEPKYQEGSKLSAKLEAMTVNTKERTVQYIKYNRARSGSVTSLPMGTIGHTCK